MSSAAESGLTSVSALFNVEVLAIKGKAPSVQEVIEAISHDVNLAIPVSKTAFFKHVAGNLNFRDEDLRRVIDILKEGMGRTLEGSPDSSLSYSHAAIICSSELASRRH